MAIQYDTKKLLEINAKGLVANKKGILAIDERPETLKKRMNFKHRPVTREDREMFREILLKTKGLGDAINGVILHRETMEQISENKDVKQGLYQHLRKSNIALGLKMDEGLEDTPSGEFVTKGLDDLKEKIAFAHRAGATFAKWRCVFKIKKGYPLTETIIENMNRMAEYAKQCQLNKIVPILEPEVLYEGTYLLTQNVKTSKKIFMTMNKILNDKGVCIPGALLKISFNTNGNNSNVPKIYENVVRSTLEVVRSTVPVGFPGVVFLSGGHTPHDSKMYLSGINEKQFDCSFKYSFSFGRALTENSLKLYTKKNFNIKDIQDQFEKDLEEVRQAINGEYHGIYK